MVDCNPEIIVFMNHMWMKLNYIIYKKISELNK